MGHVFEADEIGNYRVVHGEHSLAFETGQDSFKIHAAFSEDGIDAGLHSLWNEFPHPELPYTMLDALIVGLLRIALTRDSVFSPDGLTTDEVRDETIEYLEGLLPRETQEEELMPYHIERPKGENISAKAASLKIRDEDGELHAIVILRIDENDGVHVDIDTNANEPGLVRLSVERTL